MVPSVKETGLALNHVISLIGLDLAKNRFITFGVYGDHTHQENIKH